ncbi:MAG: glucose-1-phosphate adenylyltransferase [Oscillospiraceae bacterium]|nr:glucose-1-phosphate adenylyltransferase [Oscillospiraceae bacterium]
MISKECVAMILAGGQGSRLGALTKNVAKPAVPFGGKYRIIDFPLSNCVHSGIDTVGVLTQYQPLELNTYIGNGSPWDLDRMHGGAYVLPPYQKAESGEWYKGTANAIYQNIPFLEQFNPKYVLILSGDHIYKMHYGKMLEKHKAAGAAATIAVMPVEWEEASRFGIMNVDEEGAIIEFEEKPKNPKSNLASMGIYIFDWSVLRKYLILDENDENSSNDFGKNIIPNMLSQNEKMYTYRFEDYWKDVGTVQSLWEANMDIISNPPKFDLGDRKWSIYSKNPTAAPHYVGKGAVIKNSTVTEGCNVYGEIHHSIVFGGVTVGEGSVIKDCVIMPGVKIGKNTVIEKSVIGSGACIDDGVKIGVNEAEENPYASPMCTDGIVLIGNNVIIGSGTEILKNSMVQSDILSGGSVLSASKEKIG